MLTLTPNRRLALFLQKQQRGSIAAFQPWIEYLWNFCREQNSSLPELLSPYEENILWEKTINESPLGQTVLNLHSTAKLAGDAKQLISSWQLQNLDKYCETEDAQTFLSWYHEYQSYLQEKHWIVQSSLIDYLTEHVDIYRALLPDQIIAIGFNEWTPQQSKFWQVLDKHNVKLLEKDFLQPAKSLYCQPCKNQEEELLASAEQAKLWLQEGASNIGVVVPDLEKRREEVNDYFQDCLPKDSYNIAAPKSLLSYSLIQSAFQCLNLLFYKIPLEKWSRFLRSPYISCNLEESLVLSGLDAKLQETRNKELTLDAFISFVNINMEFFENKTLEFIERLQALRHFKTQIKGQKKASDWVIIISNCLEILQWTKGLTLDREETAVYKEWQNLLQKYQALDRFLGLHSIRDAYYHLQKLAESNSFLPSQQGWAPIQVLGLLESVGMPFDKLWVVGMHQEIWPKSPSPNPFISVYLQRKLNCPRSSFEREYAMALKYTNSLCQGAETVVFSYPQLIEDRVIRKSPLLNFLPEKVGYHCDLTQKNPNKFNLIPTQVEPIPLLSDKGNVQALKLQALCPFRAFSEIRLHSKPLTKQNLGLTRAERGEIVHDVLALFWQDTKTQMRLNALSEIAFIESLNSRITFGLERFQKKTGKYLSVGYVDLERKRLFNLLGRFLILEKTRPSFEVIALETKHNVNVGPLNLNLRIDRIDQLEDGQELLLDYKTGLAETSAWFKDPLLDPQLPLYCVTRNPIPVGFSFVVLKANEIKFLGVAKQELNIPGIKLLSQVFSDANDRTWEEQCAIWQTSLVKIAQEFKLGIASISPIEGDKTCRNCELPGFCRIDDGAMSLIVS